MFVFVSLVGGCKYLVRTGPISYSNGGKNRVATAQGLRFFGGNQVSGFLFSAVVASFELGACLIGALP